MSGWPLSAELTFGLVNSVALIVTLVVLIIQTRELTRQTTQLGKDLELNALQDVTEKLYRVYEILIERPDLASAITSKPFTSKKAFAYLVLDLYEMAYKQYTRGILDVGDWNAWLAAIDDSFQSKAFCEEWEKTKRVLSPEFVAYLERRVDKKS